MPFITIAQRKGGVGKTTVAVCLAGELSRRGQDVTLIDSDPQGSSCHWAEPGNLTFPVYQISLTHSVTDWATAVRQITNRYVIIDTAPNERAVAASIAVADVILVPCTPSGLDLEATRETLAIIRAVRQRRQATLSVILVPNRIDRRTLEGRQLVEALHEFNEAMSAPIGARAAYLRAFSAGVSVADLPGGEAASREIEALCDQILDLLRM